MTQKFTLKILFGLWLLLPVALIGQVSNSGVGVTLLNYTLGAGSQVNLGYTIIINAQVTNFDSVPFNGFINFGLHNDQQQLSNSAIFDKPPYSGDSISLAGHETVPAIFSIDVNHPYFSPGPDVVVVWPICSQPIADSIMIQLDIVGPTGISEVENKSFTHAVVNNAILIRNASTALNFKQVRIYNLLGQKIWQLNADNITTVPLPNLPGGIYLCELTTDSGDTLPFKFVINAAK